MKFAARTLATAILLVVAVVGCNNDTLPPAAGYSSVTGTILDSATNKPVAGAIVTIDTVLTATTDAAGKFTIDKVPSGIVDYSVQAQGYKVVTSSANVEPSKPFELDLSLVADTAPPPH